MTGIWILLIGGIGLVGAVETLMLCATLLGLARPTAQQAALIEHAETGMLRAKAAVERLGNVRVRVGQLRQRFGPGDLVDGLLGDLAEAEAHIVAGWQDHSEMREQVSEELRGKDAD